MRRVLKSRQGCRCCRGHRGVRSRSGERSYRAWQAAALLIVILWLASLPAFALDAAQFRQLVVLSDDYVADMLVAEAAWLADERGIVLGGWEEWPLKPMILIAREGAEPVKVTPAAAPRFALSPSREEVAYWAATGGNWAQLAIVSLTGKPPRYVGEPRRVTPAMHLAWPSDMTICALIQDKDRCVAVAISTTTGASRPLVEVSGGQWIRLRKWPGWDPIAVWAGEARKCFRLSPLSRSDEISADFDYDRARPSSPLYSFFDDTGALWIGGLRDRAPARLVEDAGAACWAPDGSMMLYTKKRELCSLWPEPLEERKVMGSALDNAGLEANPPHGITWSGDGGAIAYWRQSARTGQVRRARLGLEEIVIRAKFDKGIKATVDQPLWIAKKLHFDDEGRITEPVWATLKGKFAVRKVLPGPEETIIEAVNVGAQAGVLTRIAGRATPEPGPVPGPVPMQFTLKPIPGLIAWPQGTRVAGELLGVEVRRVALGAQH